MTPEHLEIFKDLLSYDVRTGQVTILSSGRVLKPSLCGSVVVPNPRTGTRHKLKLDALCFALGTGRVIDKDHKLIRRNLNPDDYSLFNLSCVSLEQYKEYTAAMKNLQGGIKVVAHKVDKYKYVVQWYDYNIPKKMNFDDIVPARRKELMLRLYYTKILTKFCVIS